MRKSRAILLTMLFCLIYVSVQAQNYPQVSIPNTEEHTFYSKIMDYEYGVYVTLPGSYKENPDKSYPTLYIIDGNQYFIYTFEPYNSMVWGNMIKEHIAVSVAYPPGKENMRSRDFQSSTRASDFIKFFRKELFPYIEKNYRTLSQDRTLFGHSLGGHFTLFTLLNATDMFDNYIASAPAVNSYIMKFEEKYAAMHDDLPVKLFLASGENDHLTIGAKKFAEKINSRHYPSLEFKELYTINGNHGTVQPSAYIEGLRFVLDPAIKLVRKDFERLEGTFIAANDTFKISYAGGNYLSLKIVAANKADWVDAPLVEWSTIYPMSKTSFISKGWPGSFEFGGDVSLPAESFEFEKYGKHIKAVRN